MYCIYVPVEDITSLRCKGVSDPDIHNVVGLEPVVVRDGRYTEKLKYWIKVEAIDHIEYLTLTE